MAKYHFGEKIGFTFRKVIYQFSFAVSLTQPTGIPIHHVTTVTTYIHSKRFMPKT